MHAIWKSGLLALALAAGGTAHAGDSEDFAGCDGLRKPKNKDDGMRGQASVPGFSFFGQASKRPAAIIAACDRALGGGKLRPEQTLRHAHLLRARAAARLEQMEPEKALEDIAAAQAAGSGYATDPFYRRSMGVSLDLLRAIALSQMGKGAEAIPLIDAAAAERPFAMPIQTAATVLRQVHAGADAASMDVWRPLIRLDPKARSMAVPRAIEAGDFAGAITLAGTDTLTAQPATDLRALMAGNGADALMAWANSYNTAMHAAYAHAALGQADEARTLVARVRAGLAAGRQPAENGKPGQSSLIDIVERSTVEPQALLVEARIAAAAGKADEARALIAQTTLPDTPIGRDLARLLAGDGSGPDAPVPQPSLRPAPDDRTRLLPLGRLADSLLIHPESARTLIDYKKSRPDILGALVGGALSMGTSLLGGIDRTEGFRSTPNEDGTIKVEYTGNTVSGPVVQEMTLLRAAELAREGGHAGFVIADRSDYQRYLTMTQYGIEQSRTLTGYKSELTIRYLGEGETHPAAFDTVTVIDALGPLYYDAA